MWSQLKKLKQNMATKPEELELALEAISAPEVVKNDDHCVPEPHDDGDDDGSSIEALTWSDFDEEELEIAKQLAEKEFPQSSSLQENVSRDSQEIEVEKIHIEADDDDESESKASEPDSTSVVNSVLSISSTSMSLILKDVDEAPVIVEPDFESKEDDEVVIVDDKIDLEADSQMEISTPNDSSNLTVVCKEDQASNAPVLDDGPIWAKGDKNYKFHENRRINQKLTFGVMISVVLAVGIGLGNLIAYNEYESENNKPIEHIHCPSPPRAYPVDTSFEDRAEEPNDIPMSARFPSSTHIKGKDYSYVAENPVGEGPTADSFETDANTLAYVVKSIDELSKKIDQFQNTTRQLSGIIIMKEESNTKFTELPSETSQILDETLLPEFSDEISAWENSGERQVKFSDVIVEEVQDVKRIPDTNPIESDRKEQPITIVTESKTSEDTLNLKTSLPNEEKKSNLEKPEVGTPVKTSEYANKNLLKTPNENEVKTTHVLTRSSNQQDYKRQGRSEVNEGQGEIPTNSEFTGNNVNAEKLALKEAKQQNKREKSLKEKRTDYKKQNKKYKQESNLSENLEQKKGESEKLSKESENVDKKKKSKTRKSSSEEAEHKPRKPKQSASDNEIDSNGNIKENKVYANENTKPSNKKRKCREQKENNFVLSESNNNGEMKKKCKDSRKQKDKDEGIERKLPEYKDRRDNQGKKGEKIEAVENWEDNRAQLREKQRVYQNWESDFNADDHSKNRRKRNQNWQIERDRIREKIRKTESD